MRVTAKELFNVPNILSFFRLALVPILVITFFCIPGENYIVPLIIFIVASITDTLDGIIARKFNLVTEAGMVLDPLADKLLKIATLICFGIVGVIPLWLVITLISIDIAMIIAGVILYGKHITIPSNWIGKTGTLVMTIGLILCFFHNFMDGWDMIILYSGLCIILLSVIVYIVRNAKSVFNKLFRKSNNTTDKDRVA